MEDDLELISRMRVGDEKAFVVLVGRYHASMLRLARGYVPSSAVAEEVVQDTWMGVVRGIGDFQGRSSFKTWLFRILVNRASTTGAREHRTVPLGDIGPTVDASRFDAGGHWISPPGSWTEEVDGRLFAVAAAPLLRAALEALPPRQREVVTLRDVEGLTSREVCEVLDLTEGNQRVLLHRGRSQLRQALENDLGGFS